MTHVKKKKGETNCSSLFAQFHTSHLSAFVPFSLTWGGHSWSTRSTKGSDSRDGLIFYLSTFNIHCTHSSLTKEESKSSMAIIYLQYLRRQQSKRQGCPYKLSPHTHFTYSNHNNRKKIWKVKVKMELNGANTILKTLIKIGMHNEDFKVNLSNIASYHWLC